jgi:hypothetical protein
MPGDEHRYAQCDDACDEELLHDSKSAYADTPGRARIMALPIMRVELDKFLPFRCSGSKCPSGEFLNQVNQL